MSLNHALFAALVAFLWGFNFVVIKTGLSEFPQFLFSGLRFFLVAVPLVFFIPKPKTSWFYLIAFGTMQGFLSFACMFKGMNLGITAGLSSIILQTQIFFALFLSTYVLNLKPTKQQIIGVSISIIGMFLIALSLDQHTVSLSAFSIIVVGAFFWAVANIFLKLAGSVDSFGFIIWSSLFASIPNFICSYYVDGSDAILASLHGLTIKGYGSLIFVIVMATWIAATIQAYLIKEYCPNVVAPYALLIPIVGMASSWIVLGDAMSLQTIAASSVVFIGLVINQLPARKKITVSEVFMQEDRKAA
ncbi:MAG: EamA family transporter [Candidatus Paracaedibacteraceae bacterium]|nr:EamA family transporter [Candidatus Paracaedibacteraceae bacterium]